MIDFNIIIPTRGHSLGVWATISSCEVQLANSPYTYNYSIVSNGDSHESDDLIQIRENLYKANKLGYYTHSNASITAPYARQKAVYNTEGKYLVFFDNHCVPFNSYFDYSYRVMESGIDILHSSTMFYVGQSYPNYHYDLTLDYNFWGNSKGLPWSDSLYKVAAAGHGGFIVNRSCWNDIGGYGPEGLLNGYAGEEMLFDLKAWRFGKQIYLHPKLIHYHSAATRGYSRHYTDEYYLNLMVSALVIGGEKWLDKVFESFNSGKHLRAYTDKPLENMFDLYQKAYSIGIEYSKELDSICKYSLDNLLQDVFPREMVAR